MKKRTFALITTAVIGTATLFASGFGDHPRCGHGKYGGMYKMEMMRMMKHLDLTSEQKEKFKALKEEAKIERQAKKEERKAMRQEAMQERPSLGKFMTESSFDKEAFKNEIKVNMEKRRAMMEKKTDEIAGKKADHMEKVFHILTPEQRVKMIQLSEEKRAQ